MASHNYLEFMNLLQNFHLAVIEYLCRGRRAVPLQTEIQHFKCQKSLFWIPLLRLNPPTEGFPCDDLRRIFRECQSMAKLPNSEEKLPKISTG